MAHMKIEIEFVDFQCPPSSEDIGEARVDSRVDELTKETRLEWMSLECLVRHLRAGKFGERVQVSFELYRDGDDDPGEIRYMVKAEAAPTDVYVEGLIR